MICKYERLFQINSLCYKQNVNISGRTSLLSGDHTETIDVDYDPTKTNYSNLLKLFWQHHDPTAKNKRQYMSIIFCHNSEQKSLAEKTLKEQQNLRAKPIVTSILPAGIFYNAEEYVSLISLSLFVFCLNSNLKCRYM